ncbi:MAG: hypothetical protein ABJE47_04785 [bacterium]
MSATTTTVRALCIAALSVAGARSAIAQAPKSPAARPPVCAKGVRVFTEASQVPVPYDTLRMPPADGPVRVTSPEEAEAAELAVRGRAGSVGATGILIVDQSSEENGMTRMRRSVTALYVAADSARAQLACR